MAQRRQRSDLDAVPASNESFLQAEARSPRSDFPSCAHSYCPLLAESLPASPHDEPHRIFPCGQSRTDVSESLYLDSVSAASEFPSRATYFSVDNPPMAAASYRHQDIQRWLLSDVQASARFSQRRPLPPPQRPLSRMPPTIVFDSIRPYFLPFILKLECRSRFNHDFQ